MNLASQPLAPGTLQALLLEEVFEPWQKNVLAGTDLLVLMDNLRIQKNGEYIRNSNLLERRLCSVLPARQRRGSQSTLAT